MKTFQLLLLSLILSNIGFSKDTDSTKALRDNIVLNNTITVYDRETIYIETGINENKEIYFEAVKEIMDSSKTMVIKFGEQPFGDNNAYILDISNPFDKVLKYKAYIQLNEGQYFEETSVVPIYPHIHSMEMWPYKIRCIKLTEFYLQDSAE